MRACYQSEWRLFSDSPVTPVPGRYYFCPPDTPFVSGSHHYGSRVWYDKNWQLVQGLGEDIALRHIFDNGDQPADLPLDVQLGSSACLAAGDALAHGIAAEDLLIGFPEACFARAIESQPTWPIASAWYICSVQFFYATIIGWTYEKNVADITHAFALLLGPTAHVHFFPGGSILPDVTVVICPDCSIAVVDGTTNFQQLATQAFQGVFGPADFGAFSTLAVWYNGSSWVDNCLTLAGADHSLPVMLSGHSYGAACANILAARYRLANTDRKIRTLTFGDPKAGDERLRSLLGTVQGIALADDDDLVTILCPDKLTIFPISVALGLVTLLIWDQWKRPPNQQLMHPDGSLDVGASVIVDFDTMLALAQKAIAFEQLNPITGHTIPEYRQRILNRCPNPEWPVSAILWAFLQTYTPATNFLLQEDGFFLLQEDGSKIIILP